MSMKIQKSINLKNYNTFKIPAIAKYFAEIKSSDDILELLDDAIYQENEKYFLGAWANTIFVNDFDGLIIKNEILWKEILKNNPEITKNNEKWSVKIKVWAGENWTDFVIRCAENNLVWVENLAYIPSSIWATAVQNIWAYGVEAKDVIVSVEGVNLSTKQTTILSNLECDFGYRESVFKNKLKNKFIITHVTFELKKCEIDYKFNCEYNWISEKIEELGYHKITLSPVQFVNVITEIRKSKLPDREKVGTAGSFFKNPVISESDRKILKEKFEGLKWWEVEDKSSGEKLFKLSAWQLIDMGGFKWMNNGKVGTYKTHALILVNEGPASGQDVRNFANEIKDKVMSEFWVELWSEAVFVG